MSPELVFVLEQTLGHVAHTRNIRRALDREAAALRSTVIPIEFRRPSGIRGHVPGLRSWSFEASLQARRALAARLRQGGVSGVFIHTQVASLLSVPLMRSVPTVVSLDATPRNFDAEGASYGHTRNIAPLEAVKRKLNQSVFARAAALVTWCEWAADSLVDDYGVPRQKISVVHPGVDMRMFSPPDGGRDNHTPRVLFVGGDFRRKGGEDLLEAMRGLGSDAELDVVTGGHVSVPEGVVCRVHPGLSPQSPEILNLYRQADIFVLPSRGDCFPQAVAEGLASGLPVVATTVGAIPEMVDEGVNGHLIPPADPRRLRLALASLVASAAKRRAMGDASRRLAEREHDADFNNRRIIGLMLDLAGARSDLAVTTA